MYVKNTMYVCIYKCQLKIIFATDSIAACNIKDWTYCIYAILNSSFKFHECAI